MTHTVLLFSLIALACASYQPYVPLFVWSGENFVLSQNQQIRGYHSTQDVDNLIQALWTPTQHSEVGLLSNVNLAEELELVVLFLDSSLSSEEFSRYSQFAPTLASTMKTNPSFYSSNVMDSETPQVLSSVWAAANKAKSSGAETYYLGSDKFVGHFEKKVHFELKQLNSFENFGETLENGKTDILIVYVNEKDAKARVEKTEELMASLKKSFENVGFTKYVALFTAIHASPASDFIPSAQDMGIPIEVRRSVLDTPTPAPSNTTCPQPPMRGYNKFNIYFNGTFWEIFFVLLISFGLALYACITLLQLQSPDRIPTVANKKRM